MNFSKIPIAFLLLFFEYALLFIGVFFWGWDWNVCFLVLIFEIFILALVLLFYLLYCVWFTWFIDSSDNSFLWRVFLRIFLSLVIGVLFYFVFFLILISIFIVLIPFDLFQDCTLWCINMSSSYSLERLPLENLHIKGFLVTGLSLGDYREYMKFVEFPLLLYGVAFGTKVLYPLFRDKVSASFGFAVFTKLIGNWIQLFVTCIFWMFLAMTVGNIWFFFVKLAVDLLILWRNAFFSKK